jgi:hypothetical protein
MSANDPDAQEQRTGRFSGRNPFVGYGWLSVYYREAAAAAGFQGKDHTERWRLLRVRVLLAPPKDDGLRQRAIDAIPQDVRSAVLDWLQSRELSGRQERSRS